MRVTDFSKALALLMIYLMISLTISSAAVFGMIYFHTAEMVLSEAKVKIKMFHLPLSKLR